MRDRLKHAVKGGVSLDAFLVDQRDEVLRIVAASQAQTRGGAGSDDEQDKDGSIAAVVEGNFSARSVISSNDGAADIENDMLHMETLNATVEEPWVGVH